MREPIERSIRPGSGSPFPRASALQRVLIVAPQPFFEDRGTPIAITYVARALTELGWEVEIATFSMGRPWSIPGVQVHRVRSPLRSKSIPIGFSLRKLFLDILLWRRVCAMLERREYFMVHAVEESVFLALAARRRGGELVVYDMQSSLPEQVGGHWLLGTSPMQWLGRRLERWALGRVDYVRCSAGLEGLVRSLAPEVPCKPWIFPSSLAALPNPTDDRLRAELGIPTGARVVLYSGSFADYQGLPLLVETIPAVVERVPEAFFVLLGANSASEIADVAARLGGPVRERTLILPRTGMTEVPRYIAMADVLVSTRRYGLNLPLKIFDYLHSERPIVATDIAAHRAVLNERSAMLVEPTPEALSNGLVKVLLDPALAGSLAENAVRYARQHVTWESFVGSMAQMLDYLRTSASASKAFRAPGQIPPG